MNYNKQKTNMENKAKVINASLDIVRFITKPIAIPILNYMKYKEQKIEHYKTKQIYDMVQYVLDYWNDRKYQVYITMNEDCLVNWEYDSMRMLTPYRFFDEVWVHEKNGVNKELKKIKSKLYILYKYQKDEYLKVLQELCLGDLMTDEKKEKELTNWQYNRTQNIETYKIKLL